MLWGLVCWMSLSGAAAITPAAEHDAILRQDHAWARFGKGSWRQVRIVTQSFDEQGNPTDSSITDNKTTVEEVTPERVTLKVEVTVEVAGQRFPSQPQIIRQGYAGETIGQTVSVKSLAPETITIDGQKIRCKIRQIEIQGGVTHEISRISYSLEHFPAILRRNSTVRDAAGTKTMQEAVSEVKALGMARRLLDERVPKEAFLVRQVQKNDRGVTTTWSWHVLDVPGEIVDQCSKKVDTEGRLVRRTTLELIGYGINASDEDDSFRDGSRRRARRTKRRQ